jgi:hypothetical protein
VAAIALGWAVAATAVPIKAKNSGNCFEDDPELPCAGRPMSGTVALSTVPAPQASGP